MTYDIREPDRVYGTLRINGFHCPIVNMFDIDDDETEDLELVVRVVIQIAWNQFTSVEATKDTMWPLQ